MSRYDTERGRRSRTPGSAGSISRVPPSTEILVLPDHVSEEDIENLYVQSSVDLISVNNI